MDATRREMGWPGNGEGELVSAAARGDPEAIRALYDAYRDRVWGLILFWLGDPLLAQDALQSVFFKAFRGLDRFRFQSSLFTWLYRIARNECRDHLRRRSARALPLEAIRGSRDEIDAGSGPDDGDGRRLVVENALRELPLKMREVVLLRYREGLSYEEMSRAIGCSAGTVASRLSRALAELGERLRPLRGRL